MTMLKLKIQPPPPVVLAKKQATAVSLASHVGSSLGGDVWRQGEPRQDVPGKQRAHLDFSKCQDCGPQGLSKQLEKCRAWLAGVTGAHSAALKGDMVKSRVLLSLKQKALGQSAAIQAEDLRPWLSPPLQALQVETVLTSKRGPEHPGEKFLAPPTLQNSINWIFL